MSIRVLLALTIILLPVPALAQNASQSQILERLDRLERNQAELERQMKAKDARIEELESELEKAKAV